MGVPVVLSHGKRCVMSCGMTRLSCGVPGFGSELHRGCVCVCVCDCFAVGKGVFEKEHFELMMARGVELDEASSAVVGTFVPGARCSTGGTAPPIQAGSLASPIVSLLASRSHHPSFGTRGSLVL